ncbi:MAG TPA: diguanylate cyclase [Candidatus Dormibacteraeota bacterium]|nr:diguanylate cyclase [Candidatus Dormibacteraeota bacterium]
MGGKPAAARKGGDSVAAVSNMVFLKAHEDMADTMRLILESTGEGIYGIDPRGRLTFVNRAAARMFGGEVADLIGDDVHELFHHSRADGSAYPEVECPVHRTVAEGIGAKIEDEVFWRSDGTSFPVEYTTFPILDKGVNKGAVVAFSDITDRRRMEDELREANDRQREWISDLERRNQEANLLNEMGEVLQTCYTPEEARAAIGQYVERLFPGESGSLCMLNERSLLEVIASWGKALPGEEIFALEDCWALRRGQLHLVSDPKHGLRCRHLGDAPPTPYLCVPMMAHGAAIGVLHVRASAEPPLGRSVEAIQPLARTVAEHVALAMANFNLRETLRVQSIRDPLTGLFNRRYMEETINREIPRATRYARPLGIILFDIDHFKDFNDEFGHAAGDTVLSSLGEFVRAHIRSEDIACRYGGEEIVLILPDAPLDVTRARAEMLCSGVAGLRLEHRGKPLGEVSISVGVAVFPRHGVTGEVLLRAADQALYRAKGGGRNRVELAAVEE